MRPGAVARDVEVVGVSFFSAFVGGVRTSIVTVGLLECAFDRYEPVRGAVPARPRSDHNPLNRKEYLLQVTRRVTG